MNATDIAVAKSPNGVAVVVGCHAGLNGIAAGAAAILRRLQRPGGHFPFPDLRGVTHAMRSRFLQAEGDLGLHVGELFLHQLGGRQRAATGSAA